MSTNLTPLSIRQLLNQDSYYSIPIYQRNYAWGEKEITQLIQDIADYAEKNPNKDYYIGTLVVYERKDESKGLIYETIDGQQRLTTLTILLSTLKNNQEKLNISSDISWFKLNLMFDSRITSTKTLQNVYEGKNSVKQNFNYEIKFAYEDCLKILTRIVPSEKTQQFCDYLFERVLILRVPVPADTDLNHYFEIMNSRGEQLEKHEVLKAKLLEIISQNKTETKIFGQVWEACSNMEKYVQYGFNVAERNQIFGNNDWNKFEVQSFDDLISKLNNVDNENNSDNHNLSAFDIIKGKKSFQNKNEQDSDNPDRFNSVINFPNFLLHVLRIQQKSDIPLDDKRLLDIFDDTLLNETNKATFVKTFVFNLLKCKFLFDNYVIKREFLNGTDNWSLKRLKWYNGNKVSYVNSFGVEEQNEDANNKIILMLLAMFHVSTPTLVYKHWLNATLKFAFENNELTTENYTTYLRTLAKSFLYDRYLANSPKEYFEIIYSNSGETQNTENDIDLNKLDQGTTVENFVFNYLDFLLWEEQPDENFKFTFRSSVEHYYPQRPLEGLDIIEQRDVDNFGNLCLISNKTNSRLWNLPPEGKRTFFLTTKSYESLKQKIMLRQQKWTLTEIEIHGKEMKDKILGKIK
ncbi:GmrSD restriction endonuclease domain-containing protein [Chryseobacterium vaccae]|uniref:GmrSD restriction endonuclease domain-containing protein n=1 Tax=Chryseobacterium vaccae TaxID=2604424 RepID=UPI0012981E36|nr:DUF262 domain-containing protein [Chryseobacterium vaccae]